MEIFCVVNAQQFFLREMTWLQPQLLGHEGFKFPSQCLTLHHQLAPR